MSKYYSVFSRTLTMGTRKGETVYSVRRKHPTPIAIQLHPQCLLGIQSILRNWTFLIFKQV